MLRAQSDYSMPLHGSRIGLALAGGGPLGVIYEIGALRALDESLDGIDFNHLDVYVGVSAGSVIASILVNQINTAELCRIFISNDSKEHSINFESFLRPALHEYWKRIKSVPGLFKDAILRFAQNPLDLTLLESLTSLSQAIPAGFFDNEAICESLLKVFEHGGRSNDFRQLAHKLYVVAVDLDTGESVKFGAKGFDHIPVSKTVQASTALPGLYPPVEIGGHYYVDGALLKTMHASVALDEGAELVFCLNPIVPFDANLAAQEGTPRHDTLVRGGLPVVLSQTFRSIIHSRLEVSMSTYDRQYENADVILFEPNRNDEKMFFANVFSFSNRHWVCEHAYQTIRRDLLARCDDLGSILARHGISLRMDMLEDKKRHFTTGLNGDLEKLKKIEQPPKVGERLDDTLTELRKLVATLE